MRKLSILLALVAGLITNQADADFTGKDASAVTQTWFDFTCFTTKRCPAHVIIKSDGTEIFTVTNPGQVTVANTNANGQATMANSSPVVLPSNMSAIALWGHGATGAAVPANATYFGFNSGGNLTAPAVATPLPVRQSDGTRTSVLDPCEANSQSYATGVITSATTTRIVAPSASNKTYACMFFTKASAVDSVAVVEGTGGTCGTGTAAVLGGTTTANGLVFGTAGDGLLLQLGGKVAAMQTAGTNVDLCLITSTAGPLIYAIKYVQAP